MPSDGDAPIEPQAREARVASLTRRLTAYLADLVVLGILVVLVALILGPLFTAVAAPPASVHLGTGVPLALLYFGLLDGRTGGGRTPGKALLGIRVVDVEGRAISTGRAVLRALLVSPPDLLALPVSGLSVPLDLLRHVLAVAALASFLLLVLNASARQGLHDLAARSFVVHGDPPGPVRVRTSPRLTMAAAAAGGLAFGLGLALQVRLWPVERALRALPHVYRASISSTVDVQAPAGCCSGSSLQLRGIGAGLLGERPPDLVKVELLADPAADPHETARDAALRVLEDGQLARAGRIAVVVQRGWQLGAVSFLSAHEETRTAAEWAAAGR